MQNEVSFTAEFVEAMEEEFTPDFKVVGIHFGEGDPEKGGQHWNFSQSTEDTDICVVKEIQQLVFYGKIDNFLISKDWIECEFKDEISSKLQFRKLKIHYTLSQQKWDRLSKMACRVFEGKDFFKLL